MASFGACEVLLIEILMFAIKKKKKKPNPGQPKELLLTLFLIMTIFLRLLLPASFKLLISVKQTGSIN